MSVTTYDEGVQRRSRVYGAAVTLEGLGTASEGIWYLCDERPAWAGSAWREYLTAMPDLLAERVDPRGGLPEAGEIEAQILDHRDALTEMIRPDAEPWAYLSADLTASVTTLGLTGRAVTVDALVFVGSECLRVTAVGGGGTYTVTRGALGTEAQRHRARDAARLYLPSLRTRRITLYTYPLDGADATTLREVGSAFVDQVAWDESLGVWTVRGKTGLRNLNRIVARVKRTANVVERTQIQEAATDIVFGFGGTTTEVGVARPDQIVTHGTRPVYVAINEERIRGTIDSDGTWLSAIARGVDGTRIEEHSGGDIITQVWRADTQSPEYGCFLSSPGPSPSTSRSSGQWDASDHWIDIMLCLLTSSAHPDDGLELTNYLSSGSNRVRSNWSSLPVGVGVGLPVDQIEVAAAMAIRARTPDYRFPGFEVGTKSIPLGDLLTEHFLRPIGAVLSYVGGQVRIRLPRMPLPGAASFTLGPTEILTRDVGRGRRAPELGRVGLDLGSLAGTIVVSTRTRSGAPVELVVSDATYPGTYGQRGYYGVDEGAVQIDAPSARADAGGSLPWLVSAQAARLFRWRRAPVRLEGLEAHDTLYAVAPGDVGALTLDELPDLRGARGATSLPVEVVEVEPILNRDRGSLVSLTLLAYGGRTRVGRICPSAVASAASTASGGNVAVATVANRYTAPDGADAGLPTTDAASFIAGDVVQVYSAAGVATGSARAVVSVGANSLTIAGSTAIASGAIIAYAPYANQTTTQREGWVSLADRTDVTVGAGTDAPWQIGDV